MKNKVIKRVLIVVGILAGAMVAGRLSDRVMGRKPPPLRAVPAGASLVVGAPAPADKPKTVTLSFDTLKDWTYIERERTPIPGFIRKFDGKTVEMTGYMMPLGDTKEIQSFVLMPSLFGCCYGRPPAINHMVMVKMTAGTRTQFYGDAVRVRGQFHCGEEMQGDYLVSLYRIDADRVVAK